MNLAELCATFVGHHVRISQHPSTIEPVYVARLLSVTGQPDNPTLVLVDDTGTRRTVWDQIDRLRIDPETDRRPTDRHSRRTRR